MIDLAALGLDKTKLKPPGIPAFEMWERRAIFEHLPQDVRENLKGEYTAMPIQGLTTDREAAFPTIGMLRKGDVKPQSGPGKDLDYFRFTSEDDEVVRAFYAAYDAEPRDINVILPYATKDENFRCWREHWVAGGLKHRCDGETCVIWQKEDGTYSSDSKLCPGDCKPVGRLSVFIPEITRLAFVTVLTTSTHDIMNLTDNLMALEMLNGDLRGIPMVLSRKKRKVSAPTDSGKRVRREKWLLFIEANPHWSAMQIAVQQAAAVPKLADGSLPELVAPEDDNGVIIDGETGEILSTGNGPDCDATPPPEYAAPELAETVYIPDEPELESGLEQTPAARAVKMLAVVNEKTAGFYNSLAGLLKAIRLEAGDKEWLWPPVGADEDWRTAYRLALAHAQKSAE